MKIQTIFTLLFIFIVINCSPNKPTSAFIKQYQNVKKYERLISKSIQLIQYQRNADSEIFKLKYQKDLRKLRNKITNTYFQNKKNVKQLLQKFPNSNIPYDAVINRTFNENVQMGLSIENQFSQTSFLNSLMKKSSIITARIKQVKSYQSIMKISARIPIFQKQLSTKKILIISVDLFSNNTEFISTVRKYSDIKANVYFYKYKIKESEDFISIHLMGRVESIENIGFLGLDVWNSKKSYLPSPENFQINKTLNIQMANTNKGAKKNLIRDLLANNTTIIKTSKKITKKEKKNTQKTISENKKKVEKKAITPKKQWQDDEDEE